eukprot:evm.model.NODE_20208_length_1405_cov_19.206406.1
MDDEVEAEPLLRVGDWEIYSTDDGNAKPYFYNAATEATQWDIPTELAGNEQVMSLMVLEEGDGEEEGAEATQEKEEIEALSQQMLEGRGRSTVSTPYHLAASSSYGEGMLGEGKTEEGEMQDAQDEEFEDEDEEGGGWGEAKDEETGQVYFFNRRDGSTTWDKPEGFESKLLNEEETWDQQAKERWTQGEGEEEEGGIGEAAPAAGGAADAGWEEDGGEGPAAAGAAAAVGDGA